MIDGIRPSTEGDSMSEAALSEWYQRFLDRRGSTRFNYYLPVRIRSLKAKTHDPEERAWTINIGTGGIYLLSGAAWSVGERCEVAVWDRNSNPPFTGCPSFTSPASVVRVEELRGPKLGGDRMHGVAVQFDLPFDTDRIVSATAGDTAGEGAK